MTNREYIKGRLQAFDISEAQIIGCGVDLDATYVQGDTTVDKALVSIIEELVLSPQRTNISEGGFSVSWDIRDIGKYYLYLCNKYGITPNDDVKTLAGISMVKDISRMW